MGPKIKWKAKDEIMIKDAKWIAADADFGSVCPVFFKEFEITDDIKTASMDVTAIGVYEIMLDGKRVGDFILAPGWTAYEKRLQYQSYDISEMLTKGRHTVEITVGNGWHRSRMGKNYNSKIEADLSLIAEIVIEYNDHTDTIITDQSWQAKESKVLFSDIYDGEEYDAGFEGKTVPVKIVRANKTVLIPQEGEKVIEHEMFEPTYEFVTPKGERIIDFGQEITGYVEICTDAKKGEKISLSFAEVMDKDGNFYNENYRSAKCIYNYTCKDGKQSYKPKTTFYGFRYIRVNEAPEDTQFKAIAVYSDMKRTGCLSTSHEGLNQLFSNIVWGQKGNFLDVPTDCPQRDERRGWTGDALAFVKTATYQFDVKKFFTKWLNDVAAQQRFDGLVPDEVPWMWEGLDKINARRCASAAWGDAATGCPWTLYQMYGDKEILRMYFPMMEKWISYIEDSTDDRYLWTGHESYGDWLGLDAGEGSYTGSSDKDFISSAYYKYSLEIVANSAKILGIDSKPYFDKLEKVRNTFIERFPEFKTQTEHVLVLRFDLTDKKAETAKNLAKMIHENGDCLKTGFVGTPHLLYALSENGETETAYSLVLQEKFPSWLYSVNKGATTIWEHWDCIREDGSFWSKDMNSFNHYAYGSVGAWVFEVAAGIKVDETGIEICPNPDKRMGDLRAEYESRFGKIVSEWEYSGDTVKYHIEIPVECCVTINGKTHVLKKGTYEF